MIKQCSVCDEWDELSAYYSGSSICRPCTKIKRRERNRTSEGLINQIYQSQRESSKKRHHPKPGYSVKELSLWLEEETDFYLLYLEWKSNAFIQSLRPSIDRLDDELYYTLDNIQLLTWEQHKFKHREGGTENGKLIY